MKTEWTIVIASGPSLTRADCDVLRGVGYTIAVNNAALFAPWADELFAGDGCWWKHYGPKFAWFKGHRVAKSHRGDGIERWTGKGWARTGGNSGHMAIQRAVDRGGKNIAIIGFDQQIPPEGENKGKAHFHKDHPRKVGNRWTDLGNANGIQNWPRLMAATAVDLKRRGVQVLNLSRETALDCFDRMKLEDFLEMAGG